MVMEFCFGTNALDAADKLRQQSLDPGKHIQYDLHNLVLLVKRANGTSKSILPETSILGIIYEAISKDPREEIKIIFTYSSWNNQSFEEFMLTLHKSPHAGPFHTRNVKMNETTRKAGVLSLYYLRRPYWVSFMRQSARIQGKRSK